MRCGINDDALEGQNGRVLNIVDAAIPGDIPHMLRIPTPLLAHLHPRHCPPGQVCNEHSAAQCHFGDYNGGGAWEGRCWEQIT